MLLPWLRNQILGLKTKRCAFIKRQWVTVEKVIAELKYEGIFKNPIITSVEPLKIFYTAEIFYSECYKKHLKEHIAS